MTKYKVDPTEALAELCRRRFFRFVKEFWSVVIPEDPVYNWHIEFLCDELQLLNENVVARKPKLYDLIINIPPGSTKSTIVTQMYNAWVWTVDPSQRFIATSYAHALSLSHSIKTRDIIASDKYKKLFPYVALKFDQQGKSDFRNTSGGQRFTTSTGGTVTGMHAHQIIVDDPINPQQADSEAERVSANTFVTSTLSSRKIDKKVTPMIIVMQRLHELDPTGTLLKKKGQTIKHISLPAEIKEGVNVIPKSLESYYVDGLLDPIRLDREVLDEAKIDLGTYGYSGQYDQNPSPAEGGEWQKSWFNIIKKAEVPQGIKWQLYIDGAYTKETKNDPTGLMIAGSHAGDLYIWSSIDKRLELPELIKFIPQHLEASTVDVKLTLVEPKASGKSIKQVLRSKKINATEITGDMVGMSKIERARTASPYIEGGRVYLVDGSWVEPYLTQVATFPNAAHDEHVDLTSYAIDRELINVKKKTGVRV